MCPALWALEPRVVQTCAGTCMLPQSLWVNVCFNPVDLKDHFVCMFVYFWWPQSAMAVILLLWPLPQASLSPAGKVWLRHTFRLECSSVSHFLHCVWMWVSMFVPMCYRGKLLWWWLSKTFICEYSRVSLGFICFITRYTKYLERL